MGAQPNYVIPLAEVSDRHEPLIGAKAARLGALASAGHATAPGFCLTTAAYERFLAQSRLEDLIRMELGRKPFDDMRWEEIWDAALRIRSAFVAQPVPERVSDAVATALAEYPADTAWAVRSSAPGEDSTSRSFAGLHESYIGVVGFGAVVDAVRLVWASLWSDAAMLYRKELGLDPGRSRMAVLVQTMRTEDVSGVAFGRDPRKPAAENAIVEAVPGLCAGLVDGQVDPDRWELRRSDGATVAWHPGHRDEQGATSPLLDEHDLSHLLRVLTDVESLFAWAPDVEWTGRRDRLTLLQARPITTAAADSEDKRGWYLTLRPGTARLRKLRERVADELIPALEAEGERLAAEDLAACSDEELADAIDERAAAVERWTKIYWEEFIPFAHGVRHLAVYYNDAVRPADPYEFVGLLQGEELLAMRRNSALRSLAEQIKPNVPLCEAIDEACSSASHEAAAWQPDAIDAIRAVEGGEAFLTAFQHAVDNVLDLAYGKTRLADRPDLILRGVLELARSQNTGAVSHTGPGPHTAEALAQRLLAAVGPDRREEALETLQLGRLSWRLRDNDNLLLARVQSQLIRALNVAAERLRAGGRLAPVVRLEAEDAAKIAAALRDSLGAKVVLEQKASPKQAPKRTSPGETPRQLIGQPAAPGVQAGEVRCIRSSEDLGRFRAGQVLVCDAIQPMMTHLVPLAAAIVERRGGMLIHGAIIARELGIPCVNGIAGAVDLLNDGDLVTVDGYLGIVTVGPPEFDLELGERALVG